MLKYDSSYIYQFADRLERTAREMIQGCIAMGAVLGAAAGSLLGGAIRGEVGIIAGGIVLAVLGGIIGRAIGIRRAFDVRLRAHTALCQVQIEENTRPKETAA